MARRKYHSGSIGLARAGAYQRCGPSDGACHWRSACGESQSSGAVNARFCGGNEYANDGLVGGVESMAGSYHLGFETVKDEWQQVFLPLASFEATTRGQVLRDAPGLNAEKIHSLGLAISHKQAGSFQMHVDWIKAAQKPSTLEERLVTAGCATCIFEMKNVTGCKLAVEIEGKHLLVKGTSIDDHGDAHAGDGLCNAARRSIVSGRVKEGVFVSSSLKLLPK